ncbi:MAG: hypothetical protein L6461_08565 [Anaerolineae bacterium]|nr:hypothetical protein [Anaerolineae bacterium]
MNTSLAITRNSGLLVPRQAVSPALQQLSVEVLLKIRPARPGSYYLGAEFNQTKGLVPVMCSTARSPIVLATAEYDGADSLLPLAKTAAITASKLDDNRMAVLVVTPSPESWMYSISHQNILLPVQFHQLLPRLQAWQPDGERHGLIVIEDIRQEWGITPEILLALAANPGISLFITTFPEYASSLAHSIQSARIIIGNLTRKHAACVLGSTPLLEQQLSYGQFAVRHQSRWLTFSTATQL